MKLIDASVKFPHTVIVAALLCSIFGYIAAKNMPVQLNPTVDNPEIQINTVFRGASPQEVEDQITDPIEEAMDAVTGIKRITSNSAEGRSSITLEFDWGVNKDAAMIDVINKLSQVANLPEAADASEVVSITSDSQGAIMWITLDSNRMDPNQLFDFTTEIIEPQMRRLDGVSELLVFGGEEKEMQILLSPEELVAKGVTIAELVNAVRRENLNVRGGFIEQGKRRINLRTMGQFTTPEMVGNVILKRSPDGVVYLRDVAEIKDGFKKRLSLVRVNGKQTVVIGVRRKSGANVLAVCQAVSDKVDALNAEYAQRGQDTTLTVVYKDQTYIDDAINLAKQNLLFGSLLAAAVLMLFLRSLRSVLVVAISIPICMVTVFIFLNGMGRSLNIISLAGLAFSSGMIVDNAIVVIENIYRHVSMGKRPIKAAMEATVEVWGAILISTLTTLAVFIPVIFIEEEAGQLFKDIAISISLAISLSLLVAITLIPMLAGRLVPKFHIEPTRGERIMFLLTLGFIGNWIFKAYDWLIHTFIGRKPWQFLVKLLVVALAVGFFLFSLKLLPDSEYLPSGNRNLVLIFADPIVGSNLDKSVDSMAPLEQMMLADERVERIFVVLGDRFKAMGVIVKREHSSEQQMKTFVQETQMKAFGMTGYKFLFALQAPIFSDPGKQIEVDISGPSLERLEAISGQLTGMLYMTPDSGVYFVRSDYNTGQPELRVSLDAERAADAQVRVSEVSEFIQSLIAGNVIGEYNEDGRQIDLTLYAETGRVDDVESIRRVPFLTPTGKPVMLSDIADIELTTGPTAINHVEKERSITLTVNLKPETPMEQSVNVIENQLIPQLQAQIPSNYSIRLAGAADKLNSTLKALTGALGLAILIVYLLMVSLFRSWSYPLIILVTIPLAASGAFIGITFGHWRSSGFVGFDVLSMLGLIILAGIVVNNAILIVHQALNFQAQGHGPYQALRESCASRLRPIFMSVTTSVLGMLPLAMGSGAGSELYRGLGYVMIGGLLVSTLFTLFVVPAIMALFIDFQRLIGLVDDQGHRKYTGDIDAENGDAGSTGGSMPPELDDTRPEPGHTDLPAPPARPARPSADPAAKDDEHTRAETD